MKLNVFFNQTKIGELFFDIKSKKFSLIYIKEWRENGFALSPHLPTKGDIDSHSIEMFLKNLLPEGENLESISIFKQISKYNTFGLIDEIGKDISGAISFLKSEDEVGVKDSFQEIHEEDIYKKIKNIDYENIFVWNGKVRLSIAGVGKKLPVLFLDERMGFGDGKLASTHILKFDKDDLNIVENEFLSLYLAKRVELNVNNAYIKKVKDIKILVVSRFDRELKDEVVLKNHIIDGTQLLNLQPDYKYQIPYGKNSGLGIGASVKKIRDAMEKFSSNPIVDKNEFLSWILFNLIIGNSDAHAKNISFFVDKRGVRIAPYYDILNTHLYKEHYESLLAMSIGDNFDLNSLKYEDLLDLAVDLDIKPDFLLSRFGKMILKSEKELKKLPKRDIDKKFLDIFLIDIEKRICYFKQILSL